MRRRSEDTTSTRAAETGRGRIWAAKATYIGRALTSVILAGLTAVAGSGVALGAPVPVTTERVSVSTGGAQANGESDQSSLSADGRFVAFSSLAGNLVRGTPTATGTCSCATARPGRPSA